MRDAKERAERRIDRAIDKFAEEVGHIQMELLLQKRAQDMREIAADREEGESVDIENLEGWSQ